MNKIWKHFKTVCTHKYYVGKYCFKFGLYWQGIIHDLSKFSITEFWGSVKYYQGNRSPIDAEKEDKGYSLVWAHHHNKNPHHWLYWVDFDKYNNITPMKIPYKYALEAICDWIGAGITYEKEKFTWSEPYEYYCKNTRINSNINIHPITKQFWDTILVDIKEKGIDYVRYLVKTNYYKDMYNKTGFNKDRYNKIIQKYYNLD